MRVWWALPEPRPRAGRFTARPSHPDQVAWHWALGFGLIACVVTHAMPLLKPLPLIGPKLPVHRLTGHRQTALELRALLDAHSPADGTQPILVADHYMIASLLAFYSPGHPTLRSAASRLGNRKNQYDHFPDTRLDDPQLAGRWVVLVGANSKAWRDALSVEQLRQRGEIGRGRHRWAVYTARFKPAAAAPTSGAPSGAKP